MPERLNENAYLSFPFEEDQVLVADTGEELPFSFLLDFVADVYLPVITPPRLKSIAVAPGGTDLTVTVVTELDGETLSRQILVTAGVSEWVVARDLLSTHWSALFTFGEGVNELCEKYPGQTLTFDVGFEPSRVSLTDGHAVRTMSALGGPQLSGPVNLSEGYNTSISLIGATNTLLISAQKGAGAGIKCDDGGGSGNCGELVYDVNGLTPDWFGNLAFEGGPGISVDPQPDDNRLVISTKLKACEKGCKTQDG